MSKPRSAIPPDVLRRAALPTGEKVLAAALAADGSWLLGTRRTLVLLTPGERVPIPWERVDDVTWDSDEDHLRVTAVADFGLARPSYAFTMAEPERLLQLIRERVTASIVLNRRVPVRGRLGLSVIGRRNPAGGPLTWMHAYDEGLDPDDPEVVVVADLALRQAQTEVGET